MIENHLHLFPSLRHPPHLSKIFTTLFCFLFLEDGDVVDVVTHDDAPANANVISRDITNHNARPPLGSSAHHLLVSRSVTVTSSSPVATTLRHQSNAGRSAHLSSPLSSTSSVTSPIGGESSRYWLGQYTLPVSKSARDGAQLQYNPPDGYKIVEDPITRQLRVVPGQ